MEPSRTAALAVRSQILLRDLRSQPRIFRLSHQSQRLLDLLVRNQAEKRRLLQLHGQSLAQRVVKHRIAGLVVEIGQDDGVLVGESGGAMKIEVCRGEQRQNGRGGRNPFPGICGGGCLPAPAPARRRIASGVRDLLPDTGSRFFPAFARGCASAGTRAAPRSAFRGGRNRTNRYRSGRRPVCPPFAPAPCRPAFPSPCGWP